jgi:hypothetical protein
MAAVVYLLRFYMKEMNYLLILLVCVPAGAAAFISSAILLKSPEIKELMGRA